ncbi:UDP-N-acetylglucosamine 2-epimerase, partial [bacterium]|nr:UDP-N-acetylglucosamine 2-epimerase [bacterium]
AVTKLSNLHFVATQKAAERVIRMGEAPNTVFITGCPSIDLAASVLENPALNFDPIEKYGGVGPRLDISNGYLVVMQHPVTTEYQKARKHVTETLYAIQDLGLPTLWFWPNPDAGSDSTSKGIRAFRENEPVRNIHFFKNMAPEDFLRLIYNSRCLVGNSSVAIRECSFLGIPAVNVGTRQVGRERGRNVIDVDYDRHSLAKAVRSHLENNRLPPETLYGDGRAGRRIAELLATLELKVEKRLAY